MFLRRNWRHNFFWRLLLYMARRKTRFIPKTKWNSTKLFPQIGQNQCEIHGIILNSLRPDPRHNKIIIEVRKFISKTNRFSNHYDWSFYAHSISYNILSFLSDFLYPFIWLHHYPSQIPPIPINPPHNLWLI